MLGTAFVLAGPLQLDELWLETGAGVVPVRLERDGSRIVFGWMRQPPVAAEEFEQAAELLALLGVEKSGLPVELYRQGPGHVFVELASPEAVAALRPDAGALLELSPYGTSCFARDGERWKSRCFVPAHGVAEDPATGSAAGPLALHLARHGRIGLGRRDRDPAGSGDRATVDAARRRALAGGGRGRRLGGHRRARRVPAVTRIVVIGPSGSGKTRLSARLAEVLHARHVEIDALWHGPNWESCGAEELRARVSAATEGDDWVCDGTYHTIIGEIVLERAETVAWLDLPVALVIGRLVRRSWVRKRDKVVLWHGNLEESWLNQIRWLIWPAFKRVFENRRDLPERLARHPQLDVHRLRSDEEVEAFVQSIQATESMSGSSNGSERQKTPPLAET